jgi:hypothetical protein
MVRVSFWWPQADASTQNDTNRHAAAVDPYRRETAIESEPAEREL